MNKTYTISELRAMRYKEQEKKKKEALKKINELNLSSLYELSDYTTPVRFLRAIEERSKIFYRAVANGVKKRHVFTEYKDAREEAVGYLKKRIMEECKKEDDKFDGRFFYRYSVRYKGVGTYEAIPLKKAVIAGERIIKYFDNEKYYSGEAAEISSARIFRCVINFDGDIVSETEVMKCL